MTSDLIMRMAPVIPVLVIDWEIDPVALAETLVELGCIGLDPNTRSCGRLPRRERPACIPGHGS